MGRFTAVTIKNTNWELWRSQRATRELQRVNPAGPQLRSELGGFKQNLNTIKTTKGPIKKVV